MIGDESDGAVLGNDDGEVFGEIAAETISGAMPGSGMFGGFRNGHAGFEIQCSIDNFVFDAWNPDFYTIPQNHKLWLEQEKPINGGHIGQAPRDIHGGRRGAVK